MPVTEETSRTGDMKNYAVSRLFLDNFAHIKAYWPMLGKELLPLSLSFGVDDIEGTVFNYTKIYKGEENYIDECALQHMIKNSGRIPVKRDSNYNLC